MARFLGTVKGSRGEAHRIGHKTQGLTTTNESANCGIRVVAKYEDGMNKFYVYKTDGTSGIEIALITVIEESLNEND